MTAPGILKRREVSGGQAGGQSLGLLFFMPTAGWLSTSPQPASAGLSVSNVGSRDQSAPHRGCIKAATSQRRIAAA